MNTTDVKDLELFNANLDRLLHSIGIAHVLAATMTQRMTDYKHQYPDMDDAKIEDLFRRELHEKELSVRADYDSMRMRAVTCGITLPYSIGEILDYIENSIK